MVLNVKRFAAVFLAVMLGIILSGCRTNYADSREEADFGETAQFIDGARVSYLGPEGTYTEEAALFFFNNTCLFIPKAAVDDAIDDVEKGNADYAVIPQENTLGGAVTGYVDALIRKKNMYVVGEVILPIRQSLMGLLGTSLDDIRIVCSHAQGIVQSSEWRKEHLPDADVKEMKSTAAAAKYVSESGNSSIAAVAAPGAARLYNLSVLAQNVQITDENKTRFYVISSSPLTDVHNSFAVIVVSCNADRLDDIIVQLHNAGLEPVTLHDRPEGSKLGKYNYIIEVKSEKGINRDIKNVFDSIPELEYRGSFEAKEKI